MIKDSRNYNAVAKRSRHDSSDDDNEPVYVPKSKNHQRSSRSDSDTSEERHVTWKNENHLVQRKYFQKTERPTVTLTDQELAENREKIIKSIPNSRKSSFSEIKDIDRAIFVTPTHDSQIWERPKSALIRNP